MEYRYEPEGVCSYEMIFEIENNIINNITDERFGKKRRGKRNTEDVG